MNLEKKLNEFAKYDIYFEIYKKEYYHVSVKFEDGWTVVEPENEYIHVEQRNDTYHYMGKIGSVSMEDIFNAIDETVKFNKDLEMKVELFRKYTKELEQLFSTEKYEVLKTLTFNLRKPKKKQIKKEKETTDNKEEEVEKES